MAEYIILGNRNLSNRSTVKFLKILGMVSLSINLFDAHLSLGQDWKSLLDNSNQALSNGDIRASTKSLEEALPIAINELDLGLSDGFLAVSNDLALNYLNLGKFLQAKDLFRQNLEIADTQGSILVKGNLALVYINLAKYDSAKTLIDETLKALRTTVGTRHPEFLNVLNNQAIIYYKQGNYRWAERVYKTGISQLLNINNGKSIDFANWLNNLALLYDNLARFEDALELYSKALNIYQQVKGEKSLEVAFVNSGRYKTPKRTV